MNKDDSYWLKVAYVLFTAAVFYSSRKAITTIGVQTGWIDRYETYFPAASILASVIVALSAVYFLLSNKERNGYFLASIGELRKVSWPTPIDTRRMTIIVCVVVGIFAAILAVFDLVWAKMLGVLIS